MARLVLLVTGLFLLPFAIFAGYAAFAHGRAEMWRMLRGPAAFWLAMLGALIAVAGMFVFRSDDTLPASDVYVPQRYEDGVLVPRRSEPRP